MNREQALQNIRKSIAEHGYHVYVVSGGGQSPRWVYTIGLCDSHGYELVFAGGVLYRSDDVRRVIDEVRLALQQGQPVDARFEVESLGAFELRSVDPSWSQRLLLGARDYYSVPAARAYQVAPDVEHCTLDVPDMSRPCSPEGNAVWRWLDATWPYAVPVSAEAMTSLEVLRGAPVTEASRWEEDYWEAWSGDGPPEDRDNAILVPLWFIVGADPSAAALLDLGVAQSIRRASGDAHWRPW